MAFNVTVQGFMRYAARLPGVAFALVLVLSASLVACGGASAPAAALVAPTEPAATESPGATGVTAPPSASAVGRALYWASYEFHEDPRFRLLFEGGTPASQFDEVRISDKTGAIIANVLTVPVESEPMRLCARDTRYGTARATIPVAEDVFDAFIRDASSFVVQVRVGGTWSNASLANLCHASQ